MKTTRVVGGPMMNNSKFQVFVSSTYLDLVEERQVAVEAILNAGHIPAGMELFKAGNAIKETIKKWINDSDIYMLILGGRYGTVEDSTQISYTQWEYEYALSIKKPTFAIVLSEEYLNEKEIKTPGIVFEGENRAKYNAFKRDVLKNIVYIIRNPLELANRILLQLSQYASEPSLIGRGWVRKAEYSSSNKSEKEMFEELYYNNLLPNHKPSPELREFTDVHYEIFKNLQDSFSLFLKDLNRNIRITLRDDRIDIENSTSFHYYKRKDIQYSHSFLPWLQQGKEMETYRFENIKYNHDSQHNGNRYIFHGNYKQLENPTYFQGGIGVEIPLKEDEELHNISYITKYSTEYAMFFHSYSFELFCQSFHIHIQLFDHRTQAKKKGKYRLKWEMATPYSMDYSYNSKHMIQQTDDIIEFNGIPWMTPASGYIITLNCKK